MGYFQPAWSPLVERLLWQLRRRPGASPEGPPEGLGLFPEDSGISPRPLSATWLRVDGASAEGSSQRSFPPPAVPSLGCWELLEQLNEGRAGLGKAQLGWLPTAGKERAALAVAPQKCLPCPASEEGTQQNKTIQPH